MTRRRWGLALGLGLLNAALFFVAVRPLGLMLLLEAPLAGTVFLALCIVGAAWTLESVEDLRRLGPREATALIIRGSMAGALVGAIVAFVAFIAEPTGALFVAMIGGFIGLFAGAACALLDLALLTTGAFVTDWARPAPPP